MFLKKNKVKSMVLFFWDVLGINSLFRLVNRNKVIILWYHGICDDDFRLLKDYDERHIPESLFRKQLRYLIEKGYVFVTMTSLVDAVKNRTLKKKLVTLTFDDGFRNVVKNAYPIMRELNAKGCFYVVSALTGGNKILWSDYIETVLRNCTTDDFKFFFKGEVIYYKMDSKKRREAAMQDIIKKLKTIPDNERLLHMDQFYEKIVDDVPEEFLMIDWDQIRSLDPSILEVGSHTRHHPNCENLTSEREIEDEIRNSKLEIQKETGREVKHFNYPSGSYNGKVVEHVKQYGYESAVSIIPGFCDQNTDLYHLRRIGTNENFLHFKATISGSYYFFRRIVKRLIGKK